MNDSTKPPDAYRYLQWPIRVVLLVIAIPLMSVATRFVVLEIMMLQDAAFRPGADPWFYAVAGAFTGVVGVSLFISSVTGKWQGLARWVGELFDGIART